MKDSTQTDLYLDRLRGIEESVIKGLYEEEHEEWRERFRKAVPDLDEDSIQTYFEKVYWSFCAFVLQETIFPLSRYSSGDTCREKTLKALNATKDLYKNAVESGCWDKSLEWPILSSIEEVLEETIDGMIVKQERLGEHHSLMSAKKILTDDSVEEAMSSAITWSVIRAADQVSTIFKEKQSFVSRIFSSNIVSEDEKVVRAKSMDETRLAEHKKYSRMFLSLLRKSH